MAVEAQVCPQCGAAVQFAEGQTEVVCSHCGTTVVKTASSPADRVAKELANEQFVQAMVAREARQHHHGQPAAGRIITAQATDIFRNTSEGRAVVMSFAVEVQPDGEPPFTAAAQALIGLTAVAKYQPGTLLNVRFDPQDPAQVAIEGRRGSDGNTVKTPEQQRVDWAREQLAKELAGQQEQQAQGAEPAAEPGTAAYFAELSTRLDSTTPAEPGAEPPTPAWGGPRPGGSVPVPAGFDQVTSLGPAAAVHEHQGGRLLSIFGTPRANALVRYRDGLAYRAHGNEVHTWRWEEVGAIQSDVTEITGTRAAVTLTEHVYTLVKHGGEKLILDDGLTDIEPLIAAVKAAVFALVAPPLAQRYQAGEALMFGPVTIQRQNGLQMEGKRYAWDAIQDIKVDGGFLKVTLRAGQKPEARVSAIPNIEVLCQIIGVSKLSPFDLKHWV